MIVLHPNERVRLYAANTTRDGLVSVLVHVRQTLISVNSERLSCLTCTYLFRLLCQVIFVRKLKAFAAIPHQEYQCEKKYDIYFSDGKIFAQFRYFCPFMQTLSVQLCKLFPLFKKFWGYLYSFFFFFSSFHQLQEDFAIWMSTMSRAQSFLQIWGAGTTHAEAAWAFLLQVMC